MAPRLGAAIGSIRELMPVPPSCSKMTRREALALGAAAGAAAGALTEPENVYLGEPVWEQF